MSACELAGGQIDQEPLGLSAVHAMTKLFGLSLRSGFSSCLSG